MRKEKNERVFPWISTKERKKAIISIAPVQFGLDSRFRPYQDCINDMCYCHAQVMQLDNQNKEDMP